MQHRSRELGRLASPCDPISRRRSGMAIAVALYACLLSLGLAGCHILGLASPPCDNDGHCPAGFGCASAEGVCVPLTDLEPDQDPEGLPPEACEAPADVDDGATLFGSLASPRTSDNGPFDRGLPFVAAIAEGNAGDVLTFERGEDLGGRYARAATTQGTIVVWVTPGAPLTELPDDRYGLFALGPFAVSVVPEGATLALETRDGTLFELEGALDGWTPGEVFPLIIRWDTQRPIGVDTHLHVLVGDDDHRVAETPWTDAAAAELQVLGGTSAECRRPAPAMLQGLTVFRRPLYDGVYGVDLGRGNELSRILGDPDDDSDPYTDPVDITGAWDVVFAAPTDRTTPEIDDAPDAWSHAAGDDLLEGVGDFSADDLTQWSVENATVDAAEPADATYHRGMIVAPSDPLGGAFVAIDVSPGDRLVVRAVAHAEPGSAPELMLFDPVGDEELTRAIGSDLWTAEAPGELLLTYEVPGGDDGLGQVQLWLREAFGAAAPVVWHHVEVQDNLVPNPSATNITFDDQLMGVVPEGWSADCCFSGATSEETFNWHSTPTAVRINPVPPQQTHFRIEPDDLEDGDMLAMGYMAARDEGDIAPALWVSNGSFFGNSAGLGGGNEFKVNIRGRDVDDWQHVATVGWRLRNSQHNNHNDFWRVGGDYGNAINVVIDDVYTYRLDPVALTPVLSETTAAVRGADGWEVPPGRRLELPFTVDPQGGRVTVRMGWRDPIAPLCADFATSTLFRLEQDATNYLEVAINPTDNPTASHRFMLALSEDGEQRSSLQRDGLVDEGELGEFELRWQVDGSAVIRHGDEEAEIGGFDGFTGTGPLRLIVGGYEDDDDDPPCVVLVPFVDYASDEG